MSTYLKMTKNPKTGKWERATWHDDFYGNHHYGVIFPDGTICDPRETKLLTRDYARDEAKEVNDSLFNIMMEKTKKIAQPTQLNTEETMSADDINSYLKLMQSMNSGRGPNYFVYKYPIPEKSKTTGSLSFETFAEFIRKQAIEEAIRVTTVNRAKYDGKSEYDMGYFDSTQAVCRNLNRLLRELPYIPIEKPNKWK